MRASLRALHAQLRRAAAARAAAAPTLSQLGWAAAIAGSRAYRVRGAPGGAEVRVRVRIRVRARVGVRVS